MRRAVGGMVPGVAVAVLGFQRRNAFRSDQFFQRREPVSIVGYPRVGIAARLRQLDFISKRRRPFLDRKSVV